MTLQLHRPDGEGGLGLKRVLESTVEDVSSVTEARFTIELED